MSTNDLDPDTLALIANTDALLRATEPAARASREYRAEAPGRLRAAHERGEHGLNGVSAVGFGMCAACWAERLTARAGKTYDLRTIVGRLERDLDAVEDRMAADPDQSWQWLATHRHLAEKLEAERAYHRPLAGEASTRT